MQSAVGRVLGLVVVGLLVMSGVADVHQQDGWYGHWDYDQFLQECDDYQA